jgi:hypothetical protein
MMHSPRPPKLPRLHQTNRSRRLRPLHPRLTKSPTSATSIQTIRHSTPASTPITDSLHSRRAHTRHDSRGPSHAN